MKKTSYEQNFNRLQEIVALLEDDKISLDVSLELFSEAVNLYKDCKKVLNDAQLQVDMLVGE